MLTPDRDSPLYPWHRKPTDHNPVGLFVDGPQPAQSPLVRLMGDTLAPVSVPSPEQVRTRAKLTTARKLARLKELEALVATIKARRVS